MDRKKRNMENKPLAERMRPKSLEDYIGQQHLVGPGKVLRKMIDSGVVSSFILWGPPGVGKTTLAMIIAEQLKRPFYVLSAVSSGVKDVREVIQKAEGQRFFNTPNPILFIDEIHRFSKAQQDSLLAAVEKGTVTLIGATTENPSFEVISPLLSRCQVYVLKSQEKKDLEDLIDRAVAKDYYLSKRNITVKEKEAMISYSGGDARKLLNILELVVNGLGEGDIVIDNEAVHRELHENPLMYDKDGEQHYDIVSAMIKSIRGGDPNAAVYWMARMLQGGEDPKFIARRLIISAAEDIGLANPNAILIANTCFEVVHKIGMPEARIPLSECVIYLATSPKSNSAYLAIDAAIATVKQTGNSPVPLHLRNAPTKLMKDLNYGQDYKYPHDYPGNFVEQPYLPEELKDKKFYQPQQNAQEVKILERLKAWWRKYR
ncbi:putative ATPase [Butyricimonas faecihominis]|uniref:Replication-associated recombination protein A n=2 Tax=Butyricimonas TaxID=574697 RepID=A0A7W6MZ85_9BACT|nr:putative ATPase [Butyricimonas faecihominis]